MWDSFAATINEAQARETAAIMAEKLLPAGYDIFTVDIQWYEPGATGFEYRTGVELAMDGHGRLLPAPNRFTSATGGAGFRPLADMAHALGLLFGIRSEEHTSELQSLMRISYAVFCLKKKNNKTHSREAHSRTLY